MVRGRSGRCVREQQASRRQPDEKYGRQDKQQETFPAGLGLKMICFVVQKFAVAVIHSIPRPSFSPPSTKFLAAKFPDAWSFAKLRSFANIS
jgi:hypothetical protein